MKERHHSLQIRNTLETWVLIFHHYMQSFYTFNHLLIMAFALHYLGSIFSASQKAVMLIIISTFNYIVSNVSYLLIEQNTIVMNFKIKLLRYMERRCDLASYENSKTPIN